jgi:hypothetical protein
VEEGVDEGRVNGKMPSDNDDGGLWAHHDFVEDAQVDQALADRHAHGDIARDADDGVD